MHTFQPYPISMLEFNPFERLATDWALITAQKEDKINAMTVSWGGMGVLWGKNVCYIFVRDTRYTKELIDNSHTFSLTFFQKEFGHSALKYLGAVSGRDEDKLNAAHLHIGHHMDTPYVDEGNFIFICKKMSATRITEDSFLDPKLKETWYADGNMHTMYVGEILEVLAR